MTENILDMRKKYEADVLVALHRHALPDASFPGEFDPTPLTYSDALELLGIDRYTQYIRGKLIMVYFSRQPTLDLTEYAQRNGEEAVGSVVQELARLSYPTRTP